ncbi:MAG: diguanylate cyclase domain-containing protein [Aeromonas veronii]
MALMALFNLLIVLFIFCQAQGCRERTSLFLIIFDLDNFKSCNEYSGPQKGDCPRQRAGYFSLLFCLRPTDLSCRFGDAGVALSLGNTCGTAALLKMDGAARLATVS